MHCTRFARVVSPTSPADGRFRKMLQLASRGKEQVALLSTSDAGLHCPCARSCFAYFRKRWKIPGEIVENQDHRFSLSVKYEDLLTVNLQSSRNQHHFRACLNLVDRRHVRRCSRPWSTQRNERITPQVIERLGQRARIEGRDECLRI